MINYVRLTFLMTVAMLVLTACGENSKLTKPKTFEQMQTPNYTMSDIKGGDLESDPDYIHMPDRNINAGMIFIANDVENLYVSYYLHDDWLINRAVMHVGDSEADIPVNDLGDPKIDDFSYQINLDRSLRRYTQQIPLAELGVSIGQDIVVATYAGLKPNMPNGEKATPIAQIADPKADTNHAWWQLTPYRVRLSTSGLENVGRVKLTALDSEVSYK